MSTINICRPILKIENWFFLIYTQCHKIMPSCQEILRDKMIKFHFQPRQYKNMLISYQLCDRILDRLYMKNINPLPGNRSLDSAIKP